MTVHDKNSISKRMKDLDKILDKLKSDLKDFDRKANEKFENDLQSLHKMKESIHKHEKNGHNLDLENHKNLLVEFEKKLSDVISKLKKISA